MIIGIVAIAKNYAIGKDGKLPWHYSADLKFFKQTTTGNVIVMGANTWRSIGKPLPNRHNIVLTRSSQLETPPEIMKLGSPDEVVKHVYIIGGAKVFDAFADLIEKWIVTHIPEEIEGADTFMPHDFLNDFEVESTTNLDGGLQVKILHRKQT
ncbi:MAG: dihydrofolate reductase [Acidobacteria bacterium]|nr:dihydrofolate reductase [Acidobacteriota bacterium]